MKNYRDDILCHYGIKGQKHGHRRFQNEDGSLTAAGRARYLEGNKSAGVTGGTAKAVTGMYTNARNAISKAADEANRRRMAASGKSSASRVSSDTTDAHLGRRTISRRNDDGSHTSETRYSNKFAEKQGEGFVSTRTNRDGSYQNTYKVAGGGFERYDSKTGKTTRVSPEAHPVIKGGKNVEKTYDKVFNDEQAEKRHVATINYRLADRKAGMGMNAARAADEAKRKAAEEKRREDTIYGNSLHTTYADRKAGTSYGAARSAEDAKRKAEQEKSTAEYYRAIDNIHRTIQGSSEMSNAAARRNKEQQNASRREQERRAGMSMNAAMAASKAKQDEKNAQRRMQDRKAGIGMNAAMAASKAKQAAQEKANASRSKPASSLSTALNNLKRKLDTAAAQKKADDEKKKRQRSGRRGSYYGG